MKELVTVAMAMALLAGEAAAQQRDYTQPRVPMFDPGTVSRTVTEMQKPSRAYTPPPTPYDAPTYRAPRQPRSYNSSGAQLPSGGTYSAILKQYRAPPPSRPFQGYSSQPPRPYIY